jgi:amino acid adenylation domain-containing protein
MSIDHREDSPVRAARTPAAVEPVSGYSFLGCVGGCSHHAVVLCPPERLSPSAYRVRLAEIMRNSPFYEAREAGAAAGTAEREPYAAYFDSVPSASTTPQGRTRLLREMGRCLPDACGIVLRSVALSFSDVDAVVLTASGTLLDRAALEKIGRLASSGGDRDALLATVWWDLPRRSLPGHKASVRRQKPAAQGRRCWDMPGGAAGASELHSNGSNGEAPTSGSRILDIAAIAHAIARHRAAESVSIGVSEGYDLSSHVLGAAQPTRGLEVANRPQDTVGDLLQRVEQALSRPAQAEAEPTGNESEPLHALIAYPSWDGSAPSCASDVRTAYFPGTQREIPYVFAMLPQSDGALVYSIGGTSGPDDEAMRFLLRDVATVRRCLTSADRATPLASLEFLSPEEVAATLACAEGRPTSAIGRTICHTVARAAREHPDNVAVSFEDEQVTYRELDEMSGRVAAGLAAMGVARGQPVGVCVRRSAAMIGLLLGILKSGSAYVPVDIGYPTRRITFTCQDAGVRLLIADDQVLSQDLAGLPAVSPASLLSAAQGAGEDRADQEPDIDDLAYVIYTSGSTGTPKGVGVTHRNVMSLIESTSRRMGFTPDDVWSQFHSVTFDFSVWEIWACLCNGGRLVVVPYFTARSPDQFLELLLRERVTVLNQTPTAFGELTRALGESVRESSRESGPEPVRESPDDAPLRGEFAARSRLRLVVFGGEALDPRILADWFRMLPRGRCEFVNMYGITETTVHVTAQRLDRSAALDDRRSVGRAIPGWRISVRDLLGRLLPPGVPGEIYVGGAGVASGYLNRPRLTAERFVHDRYTRDRAYRSGDAGILRPDGSLEHLGRLDNQVKIRGYRIELNEIRSVLRGISGVRDAAVKAAQDAVADARIDAYLVPKDAAAGDAFIADVRTQTARTLPGHMIPGTWTLVDHLPLTANGKLDITRLPDPTPPVSPNPRQEQEKVDGMVKGTTGDLLHRAWQDVFGYDVSPDVNFFDNGGTSLLALRLVRLLRDRTAISLTVQDIYRHPTISQLTAHLAGSAPQVAS